MKKMEGRTMKRTFGLLCVLIFAVGILTMWGAPPSGVTPHP